MSERRTNWSAQRLAVVRLWYGRSIQYNRDISLHASLAPIDNSLYASLAPIFIIGVRVHEG